MVFRSMNMVWNGFILLVYKSRILSPKSGLVTTLKVPQWVENKAHNVLIAGFWSALLMTLKLTSLQWSTRLTLSQYQTRLQKLLKQHLFCLESAGGAHPRLLLIKDALNWAILFTHMCAHPLTPSEMYMGLLAFIIYTVADCLESLILISSFQTFAKRRVKWLNV